MFEEAFAGALGLAGFDGTKEILGLWIEQTEGAKFWLRVMNELKNRGVEDVLIAVVDGLKGFPEGCAEERQATPLQEFFDGAASWSRVERIIARVEVGAEGPDTRFVVTNLKLRNARVLYEDVYCRRGQAENHIKSWKTHLAADRTSCTKATANQFRLFLHAGAYWLMWGLRASMPRRSMWRVAQFDTLRLRLIKVAARVVEMKTMIRVHLPASCPAQDILRLVLGRIPRLVT